MRRVRAQYGKVISGAVDYTPEGLDRAYGRHMDNLLMTEAIRQEAQALQAAPFEGDEAYRNDLLQRTDQVLQEVSKGGAYGNLSNFTGAVNRTATEYKKRSAPITKNAELFSDYQKALKDLHDKGKIDNEDYKGTLALSMLNKDGSQYTGLTFDEQGNADNYFNGLAAVHNPDINKMLIEALNGMKADGEASARRVIGQGPDGSMEIETAYGVEYIRPERVQAAMQMVMQDSRVQSYLDRKAEIRTKFMDDGEANKGIKDVIESLTDDIATIDERLAGKLSDKDRANMQTMRDSYIEKLGDVSKKLNEGTLDEKRNLNRAFEFQRMNNMYEKSAIARYSFEKVTENSYKEYWDKMYMQLQQQGFDMEQTLTPVSFEGNMVQYKNPYGATDLEAVDKRNGLTERYDAAVKLLTDLPEDASPELVEQYLTGVRTIERDIRAHDDYILFRYGSADPNVLKTEGYLALDAKVKQLEQQYEKQIENGGNFTYHGSFWMDLLDSDSGVIAELEMARRKRLEYVQQNAEEDPLGADLETSFSYANAQSMPQFRTDAEAMKRGKAIDGAIKTYFEAIPDDMMIYIPGRTGAGEMVSYGEAVGRAQPSSGINVKVPEEMQIPADAKYASHGISLQAPTPELGPTLQINYTSETEGNGSYIVPLNQAVNIPELAAHLNTPSMKVYGEIERYGRGNVTGMTRSLPMTSDAGPGTMEITYRPGGPTARFILADGTRGEEFPVDSQKFHNAIERHNITI